MKAKFLLTSLFLLLSAFSYAQKIDGSWKGSLDVGTQKLEIIFYFSKGDSGDAVATMDVPEQSALGIPVKLNLLTEDSVSLEVAAIKMAYEGRLEGGRIKGIFRQMGFSFPLELQPGNVEKQNRPQEPVEPFAYMTENVRFHNKDADVWLSGTLSYPTGYTKGKKVPVVIMVSGSGPQNRDEEVFGHKPFLVIADYLAKNGIASLRYDDRGVGESTGSQSGCTSADFADDAECGLQFLKERGEFSKVGVLGHSEGGLIAFMLGADKKADFIVSLAGPGIKGDTLLAEQNNAILKSKGLNAGTNVKELRESMSVQPKNSWMEFFMNYDPQPDIERTDIPVMAINGANDLQVIAESNLKAIERLLSGKNEKNFIKEYQGLNHLFQHCTPETAMDYYKIEETCSAEVLKDIADWINGL